MNTWIWRLADRESDGFYAERAELLEGRLRQGWGFPGGDIRLDRDSYLNAWKAAGWPLDENEKSRSIGPMRRYSVLKRMREIQRDDLIVIPRVSVEVDGDGDFFTIATVVNTYSFEVLDGFADFGHIIGVDPKRLRSYRYDRDAGTRELGSKLTGMYPYGRAVSRIGDGNGYLREIVRKLA